MFEDISIFLGASALLFYALRIRKSEQRRSEVTNPQIQAVNRLPSHVVLSGFNSEKEARSQVCDPKCSPFAKVLSGNWKFSLFPDLHSALQAVGSSCGSAGNKTLSTVPVPGCWQLQIPGDSPIPPSNQYPFPVDVPKIPTDTPCGLYHHCFQLSPSMAERRVILNFGAVDSAYYVWLNKSYVGFSKDSRLPTEFDITDYCKFGSKASNDLEVVVARYSDGSYLESQSHFKLSGILRDVIIYSLPKQVHISDFQWHTTIDSRFQIANIEVDVQLRWDEALLLAALDKHSAGEVSRHQGTYQSLLQTSWVLCTSVYEEGVLVRSLYSPTAHTFFFDSSALTASATDSSFVPVPTTNNKNGFNEYVATKQYLSVNCPTLWSPERPHVYTLVISLRSALDGTVVQAESCRVGFRNISISNGTLRLNSRPIVIRGVNYTEHDGHAGHAVSSRMIEADIQLMKRNNFNAVRTSHYPQCSWFYELCTLYGVAVIDEANIETRGMVPYTGKLADDPSWKKAYMLRLRRMFERDKVHPSIVGWSLGNASGYGAIHDAMADWIRSRDSSRIVLYEPATFGPRNADVMMPTAANHNVTGNSSPPKLLATDLLFPMYARISECITLANMSPDMPVILSKYANMTGNSGGNLYKYWQSFRQFPRLQGGFIWTWTDQALAVVDSQGYTKWSYGCDYGAVDDYQASFISGLHWPDRGLRVPIRTSSHASSGASAVGKGQLVHSSSSVTSITPPPASKSSGGILQGSSLRVKSTSTNGNAVSEPNSIVERRQKLTTSHSTGVQVSSTGNFPSVSFNGGSAINQYISKRRFRQRYGSLYGLSGCKGNVQATQNAPSSARNPNPSGSDIRTMLQLDRAVTKPALLEAKQCMRCFDCGLIGLKMLRLAGLRIRRPGPTRGPSSADLDSGSQLNIASPWRRKPSNIAELSRPQILRVMMRPERSPMAPSCRDALIARTPFQINESSDLDIISLQESVLYQPFIRLSIVNNYDHIDDIETELNFTALMLCNGLVVAVGALDTIAAGFVHHHHHAGRSSSQDQDLMGRHSIQELDCEAFFSLETFSLCRTWLRQDLLHNAYAPVTPVTPKPSSIGDNKGTAQVMFGIPWPETALLDADTLKAVVSDLALPTTHALVLHDDGSTSLYIEAAPEVKLEDAILNNSNGQQNEEEKAFKKLRWTMIPDSSTRGNWSMVVVGCLASHTSWASRGYPLGFQQIDVSRHMRAAMASVATTASNTTAGLSTPLAQPEPTSSSPSKVSSLPLNDTLLIESSFVSEPQSPRTNSQPTTPNRSMEVEESQWTGNELAGDLPQFSLVDPATGPTNDMSDVTTSSSPRGSLFTTNGWPADIPSPVSVRWGHDLPVPLSQLRISGSSNNLVALAAALPSASPMLFDPSNACVTLTCRGRSEGGFAPVSVAVVVNANTGMMDKLLVNGTNILAAKTLTLPEYFPSRLQLHRACTEHDKKGFGLRWKYAGLDSALQYVVDGNGSSSGPVISAQDIGQHVTGFDYRASPTSPVTISAVNGEEVNLPRGEEWLGVLCGWSMRPTDIDRRKLYLIDRIQEFEDDPSVHYIFVRANSHAEEVFIHQLAESTRICRESIWSDSDVLKGKGPALLATAINSSNYRQKRVGSPPSRASNDTVTQLPSVLPTRAVLVRLWKPIFYMHSSGRKAEMQVIGPFSYWESSESVESVVSAEDTNEEDDVRVEMIYLLSPQGELYVKMRVDASGVVVPLPRVGLNFLLDPNIVNYATWRGAGPHESYPDRKASTVSSIHCTNVDNLAVPYIVPGECGGHTDTQWLQLGSETPKDNGAMSSATGRTRSRSSSFAASNTGTHSSANSIGPVQSTSVPTADQQPAGAQSNDIGQTNNTAVVSKLTPLSCTTPAPTSTPSHQSPKSSSYGLGGRPKNRPSIRIAPRNNTSFNFSLLPYTVEDLSQSKHFSSLEYFPRPYFSLNLDPFLMGLGGDDNVAASVQDDFLLPPDEYKFEFLFNFFDDI